MAPLRNHQPGFTLGEMMIALAVLAIALAIGVPAYQDAIANNRMTATVNQLIAALNLARSEAVKRGGEVAVCGSSDQAACDGDWGKGWMVYTDANVAGAVDDDDEVLSVWAPSGGMVTVVANGFTISDDYVRFRRDGQEADRDSGFFDVCDGRDDEIMRQLEVSSSGRIRLVDAPPACDGGG